MRSDRPSRLRIPRASGPSPHTGVPLALAALLLLASCATLTRPSDSEEAAGPESAFALRQAPPAPAWIGGIRLHPAGSPADPPILKLDGDRSLVLSFDALESRPRRFEARIVHRDRHWGESPLSRQWYVDGFGVTSFGGGRPSYPERPSYTHYRLEFPSGSGMGQITASGNYLLEVRDHESGRLLFALPFLVHEDAGELMSREETIYPSGGRQQRRTRLYSDYRYPEKVDFPGFDLGIAWVPERMWGRMRTQDYLDTASPGMVRFQQSRENAFPQDFHKRYLDLRGWQAGSGKVKEVVAGDSADRVILRRDTRNFPESLPPYERLNPAYGLSESARSASYAEVRFSLEGIPAGEDGDLTEEGARLYVAGTFNGWSPRESNRLRYRAGEGLWEGTATVKEGEHLYAYLALLPSGEIRLVGPPSSWQPPRSVLSLVYYRDPARNHDRLLKAGERIR